MADTPLGVALTLPQVGSAAAALGKDAMAAAAAVDTRVVRVDGSRVVVDPIMRAARLFPWLRWAMTMAM
jgi:hypothetical protein